MSRSATLAGFLGVALSLAGCYQDDTTVTAPPRLRPRITVRLTDAPFPYDSLQDRKSTRLNSSHGYISYAVFCLKKKKNCQVSAPPYSLHRNLPTPQQPPPHRP